MSISTEWSGGSVREKDGPDHCAPVALSARLRRSEIGAVGLASGGDGFSGYSCGTAPDLHRLRHCALASEPKGHPYCGSMILLECMGSEEKDNGWGRVSLFGARGPGDGFRRCQKI